MTYPILFPLSETLPVLEDSKLWWYSLYCFLDILGPSSATQGDFSAIGIPWLDPRFPHTFCCKDWYFTFISQLELVTRSKFIFGPIVEKMALMQLDYSLLIKEYCTIMTHFKRLLIYGEWILLVHFLSFFNSKKGHILKSHVCLLPFQVDTSHLPTREVKSFHSCLPCKYNSSP